MMAKSGLWSASHVSAVSRGATHRTTEPLFTYPRGMSEAVGYSSSGYSAKGALISASLAFTASCGPTKGTVPRSLKAKGAGLTLDRAGDRWRLSNALGMEL